MECRFTSQRLSYPGGNAAAFAAARAFFNVTFALIFMALSLGKRGQTASILASSATEQARIARATSKQAMTASGVFGSR